MWCQWHSHQPGLVCVACIKEKKYELKASDSKSESSISKREILHLPKPKVDPTKLDALKTKINRKYGHGSNV